MFFNGYNTYGGRSLVPAALFRLAIWAFATQAAARPNQTLSRRIPADAVAQNRRHPRRTYDAAFAASTAQDTLWRKSGPQNGSGEFAQLDGSFLWDPPAGASCCGVRCSAGGITSPANPQLGGLKSGAAFRTRRIRHQKTLPLTLCFAGQDCPVRPKRIQKNAP